MEVHDIKTKKNKIFNVRVFLIYEIIYSKNQNPFWGELPKYDMQYIDMALENKYIFTCSRKLEVMNNN